MAVKQLLVQKKKNLEKNFVSKILYQKRLDHHEAIYLCETYEYIKTMDSIFFLPDTYNDHI